MKKFGKLLIFVGLLLIGGSLYQEFVGDIPFLNLKGDSEIVGPLIEVKKVDNIEYETVGGASYDVNKEFLEETIGKSFYLNTKLDNEAYRMYFKYPESFTLLSGTYKELVFGSDKVSINFYHPFYTYDEYVNARKDVGAGEDYFARAFTSDNEVSKVRIINVFEGNNDLFIGKAMYMISGLNDESKPLEIDMKVLNKKLPDKLILDFYNSFAFQKIDSDFKFCKKNADSNSVCSFKLNNYDNSSRKKVTLTVDDSLFTIEEPENPLIPSYFSLKAEGITTASFTVLYDGNGVVNNLIERYGFVEEIINGRKFMVQNGTYSQYKKTYTYEIQPNMYIVINIDTNEELFDKVSKTFLNFKVR